MDRATRAPAFPAWSGAARMAHDRALFHEAEWCAAAGEVVAPTLRFWTWAEETISLGFLEPAAGIEAHGLPLVRRPTGGGAILHGVEWTYTALVALDHPRLGGPLAQATCAIVGVIAAALGEAYGIAFDPPGGEAPEEGTSGRDRTTACFARRHGHELAVGGRKLMGSAQRRGRRVLLQQGSLLVGPGHERLARHLTDAPPGLEARLARAAVPLGELLAAEPDPRPFADALGAAWSRVASDRGEAPRGPLDSLRVRS